MTLWARWHDCSFNIAFCYTCSSSSLCPVCNPMPGNFVKARLFLSPALEFVCGKSTVRLNFGGWEALLKPFPEASAVVAVFWSRLSSFTLSKRCFKSSAWKIPNSLATMHFTNRSYSLLSLPVLQSGLQVRCSFYPIWQRLWSLFHHDWRMTLSLNSHARYSQQMLFSS